MAWPASLASLLALATCLAAAPATGGDLRIAPVSLTLQAGEAAAVLWLSNTGQAPMHAQARIFAWTQVDGREVLAPTRDLAVSPPLLEIPPQQRQLVRVLRLTDLDPAVESSYRLVVDELPAAAPPADAPATPLLRYSLPVFVPTAAPPLGARLSARVEDDAGGRRMLRLDNTGDRHARIAELAFIGAGGRVHPLAPNLAGYVLAGRYKHWPMPADAGDPPYGRFQADVDGRPVVLVPAPDRLGGR
ncbi:fimbrial biogenesis chaperone [Pseudoxanthomonas broegbernensis]|nr:fimbria/pilus periplasmic chaperone [Pseudoxanthomonas broegbernensis]MBB6063983.1 fimbrial chaperone protein [Pseudoxanthomonas broegbernensis]